MNNCGFSPSEIDSLTNAQQDFLCDVFTGLGEQPRSLPCKYLYDQKGSELFDAICETPEYYPTRTEAGIMRRNIGAICEALPDDALLVEYGSGSSVKTALLLENAQQLSGYVPVDISEDHLLETAERLRIEHPELEISPVAADFTQSFELPEESEDLPIVVYFPGSTIGNFDETEAKRLLKQIRNQCRDEGGLLIGFDLYKDSQVLEAAYNDKAGITAAFNLNLLTHINRELQGNFDLENFKHVAKFVDENSRIEIYLESLSNQTIEVFGKEFEFESGERVHTENSHKYKRADFESMANEAGLKLEHLWTDDQSYFAVAYFVPSLTSD